MSEEFEVHGHHDELVEHGGREAGLGRLVAMITAVLACIGAIISYQNSSSESLGLESKNEAILKKSEASDQWGYYQAKGIKESIVAHVVGASSAEREALVAEAKRYAAEKADIQKQARALDEEAKVANEASERAFRPHRRLAQALALVQVGIALAALTVLTRQRWLLGLSVLSAVAGIASWIAAFH